MSLWLSVTLAALAVLVSAPTLVHELIVRGAPTRPRRRLSPRTRAGALIAFLTLIIIAQFVVFLSATDHAQRDCANGETRRPPGFGAQPSTSSQA